MPNQDDHSYTKKVASNTLIQIIGKVITTATSLVLITALTRYLGVEGYGEFTTIFSYVSFFAVFADLGFFSIMVREISKPHSQTQKIVNNIMTVRSILGIVVFLLCFVIALFLPAYNETIKYGIGIIAFGWFWTTINSTYVGVFQAKHQMYKATLTDIIGRLIILGLVLFFIQQGYSLLAIVSAYAIGNMINFLGSVVLGWGLVPFRFAFDYSLWRKMFAEALPMGIVLLFGVIYLRIDSVMLSLMKTQTDVGIYGAPYKILEILALIPGIFMGNVFPVITRYYNEKDDRLYIALQKSFDFLATIALPLVAGTFLLAMPIIGFIAGGEFQSATTLGNIFGHQANSAMVLQILIFATGIIFISQIFTNTAVAIGKQRELVWPYILFAGVNIVINLLLIPKLSYIGASIATVITEFLVLLTIWQIVKKHLPLMHIKFGIIWKAVIAVLAMSAFLYYCSYLNLFIQIIAAIIIYFVVLYAVGGYNKDMIKMLIKK
mgnify:CR=1 FL=1